MLQKVVESKWIKPAFEAYRNNLEIANQTLQRTPGRPSVLAEAGGGAAELVVNRTVSVALLKGIELK